MKKYIIVLFLVIAVGCGQGQQSSTSKESELNHKFPPPMFVIIEDREYKMVPGNYWWEQNQQVTMTDAASPNQIATDFDPIKMGESRKIDIVNDHNSDITVYLWNEKERVEEIAHSNEQIQVPDDQGEYIYEVVGEWPNGEADYTIVVEVE